MTALTWLFLILFGPLVIALFVIGTARLYFLLNPTSGDDCPEFIPFVSDNQPETAKIDKG